ncbi:carbon monoxide dehydrogenase [Acidovorax sp. GW101-3H11]|jgi:carbon monoxide dehydrogenase subunit G|uniref:CoxG family protein n=1 Tax=Acidovorax sp. GW101-3H11 TaxID=1813946 RepID=UPI0007B50A34|nr:carbon monoxide dehydrogenase subunit G [Acidovorax sp. GW101-3H11]KZT13838.1 carbon monoxide dehydrogenase [Acidovorax sp. GW101-3H11]
MEMQASRTLAVSQQQAWEALNDPEVLKLCIPGCDKVEPTGDNQYAVAMALKIGPVSAKFAGKITLSDIVPPESYNIAFDGSGGVAGFGKGNAQVKLVPLAVDGVGQASCELHYTVHATVGGKIAQLGQRLIDGAAKTMAEDFFKRFDNEMQRRFPRAELPQAGASDAVQAEAITPPGGGGGAIQGGGIPAWAWGVGAGALVLLAWWFNRG